jgi:hypothetical protein
MDEVRLSDSIRSADWISAEFINQSDHDNFQSLCAEETDTAAVTSAVAEISPADVTTSSTGNSFSYDIQATISGSETGVNRVAITVPGTFGAPTVTDVLDDGVSVGYTDNTSGNAISVDITTKITATSKITVLFNADAPTTQDLTGVDFTSTVDDSGTGGGIYATTEGDGDGNAGDANTWTVTTCLPDRRRHIQRRLRGGQFNGLGWLQRRDRGLGQRLHRPTQDRDLLLKRSRR